MEKTVPTNVSSVRGRPREFDVDQALDKAIEVFCKRGYHAASITELTSAMDLASGSVYKAFKDKRAIFLASFDRYTSIRDRQVEEILTSNPRAIDRLKAFLEFYAELSCGALGQRGCLVVNTATELALFDREVAERVAQVFRNRESTLAHLICQGQVEGSIPSSVDCDSTARTMLCITHGMRVIGKTSPCRESMMAIVDVALKLVD